MDVPLSQKHGFSLIEIAIVFLILAMFAGGLVQFLNSHQLGEDITATNTRLDEINESIKRYYGKNGYVPCPASATAAESNTAFGTSSDCSAAAPAGTWEEGTSTNVIRFGVIPFRTLGLSPRYMYDSWGNRIAYAVVKRLAIDSATYSAFTTALTDGIIPILDAPLAEGGHSLIPSSGNTYVVYAVISAGSDKLGAYGNAGTLIKTCGSTTNDSENCDYQAGTAAAKERVLVDMPINESPTATDYYNDYIRWTTNDDLDIFVKTGS